MAWLDDVIIYSRTWEEHVLHVRQLLKVFADNNIKLKAHKCHFGMKELRYIGFIVGRDGIRTSEHILKAVREFPTPTTKKAIEGFIGLVSYYCRYIPSFSYMTNPLRAIAHDPKP